MASEAQAMKPVKSKRARRRREIAALIDPKTSRRFERGLENALIDLEEAVDERYESALKIYHLQDERTRDVIKGMATKMQHMAGRPNFTYKGVSLQADPDRLTKIQERNLFWIAVRLLVACAEYDIQIANFKLPDDNCAKCGKQTRRK
jgi:hypothetical protein